MTLNFDALNSAFKEKKDLGWGGIIVLFIFILLICFGIDCLFWWIGMLLWNGVACAVFTSLPTITFWQFAGLEILTSILFKTHTINSNKKD